MDFTRLTERLRLVAAEEIERANLQERGIANSPAEVEVWKEDPEVYTSELRIYFSHDGQIFDALETFLFENGVQQLGENELREWIRDELETIRLDDLN